MFYNRLYLFIIFQILGLSLLSQVSKDSLLARLDRAGDFNLYTSIADSLLELEAEENQSLAKADYYYRLHSFHCAEKDHEAAEKPLEQFFAEYQDDLPDSVIWLHKMHLAYHYQRQQAYYKAMPYYEWVVEYEKENDISPYNIIRHILMSLGNIYTRTREYEKAETTFRRVLRLAKEEKSLKRNISNYGNLAKVFSTKGEAGKAIEILNEGLKHEGIQDISRIFLLYCKAVSQLELEQFDELKTTLDEGLTLLSKQDQTSSEIRENFAEFYQLRGELAFKNENYPLALFHLENSHSFRIENHTKGKVNRELTRNKIALAAVQNKLGAKTKAILLLDEGMKSICPAYRVEGDLSLPKSEDLVVDHVSIEVLDAKGELFVEIGQDEPHLLKAIEALLLAQVVEDQLRNTFASPSAFYSLQERSRKRTENLIHWYNQLYQLSNDDNYLAMAFYQAERNKARLLTDKLLQRQFDSSNGIDSLFQIKARLRGRLAKIEERIQNLKYSSEEVDEDALNQLREDKLAIQVELQSLGNEKKQIEITSEDDQLYAKEIQAISEKMIAGQVLFSYFAGSEFNFVFRLDHNGQISLKELTPGDCLNDFISLIQDQGRWQMTREEYSRLAYCVFEDWFAPVYQEADQHLMIAPDGLLAYLPYDLILTAPAENSSWGNMPYLLRNQVVQQVYSGRLWLQQLTRRSQKGKALLIAPVFDNGDENPAPIAQLEVEMGADLAQLPIDELDVAQDQNWEHLIRVAATKNKFLNAAPNANLIHFFTHADISSEDQLPWIHFVDEQLNFTELEYLDLPADLIILSACETHLGRIEKGEGVLSLSHGFTQAGSASQIASLWRVKALATAQLFNQFYKELDAGKTKAEALQAAKLHYLSTAPDMQKSPAYWGGFVFSGADGLLQLPRPNNTLWYILGAGLVLLGGMLWMRRKSLS